MKMEEMTKHVVFVEGAGEALIQRGVLQGPVSITPKGIAAYDQLMASGWKPQHQIVRSLLRDKGVPEAQLEMTTDLFMRMAEQSDKES